MKIDINKYKVTKRITELQVTNWGADFDFGVTIGDENIDLSFLPSEKKSQILTMLQFTINEKD